MTDISERCMNAYRAAIAADDAYRVELVRVYGRAAAATARYRYTHEDPACQAAGEAKLAADAELATAQLAARARTR